eukprot:Rmarinus@m.600
MLRRPADADEAVEVENGHDIDPPEAPLTGRRTISGLGPLPKLETRGYKLPPLKVPGTDDSDVDDGEYTPPSGSSVHDDDVPAEEVLEEDVPFVVDDEANDAAAYIPDVPVTGSQGVSIDAGREGMLQKELSRITMKMKSEKTAWESERTKLLEKLREAEIQHLKQKN